MSIHLALTVADISEDEWVYEMQYLGKITRATVNVPIEAMSPIEQEAFISRMIHEAFNIIREQEMLKRPEDRVEEVLASLEADDYDEDEEEDLYDLMVNMNELQQKLLDRIERLENINGINESDTE